MDERLKKQFDFIKEIDKEKFIQRQTLLTGGERKENDAEHAWHMALMTVLLSEYANEKIDVLKTVTMLLLHDIVEIDAGDTYCYDEEGKKTQHEREQKAADRIFGLLPDDQCEKLKNLWIEFENAETAEAKFAHTMDNVQPVMLNDATDGKMWAERKIKLKSALFIKSLRLCRYPVAKLSKQTTLYFLDKKYSQRLDPIKPAPPVIKIVFSFILSLINSLYSIIFSLVIFPLLFHRCFLVLPLHGTH